MIANYRDLSGPADFDRLPNATKEQVVVRLTTDPHPRPPPASGGTLLLRRAAPREHRSRPTPRRA